MIVCGKNAVFGLPEVKRSVIAGAGGCYRLPRAISRAVALEMIATGDPIDAARALDLGLVNRVAEDVTKEALALADRICANAPVAVQESLVVARSAAEATEKELQALVMKGFAVISRTRDFQEGPLAFMEKREPRWTGE
jgi:enoyl-CoA hydratase/carnithine racemase